MEMAMTIESQPPKYCQQLIIILLLLTMRLLAPAPAAAQDPPDPGDPGTSCICDCHGNPVCDDEINLLDAIRALEVAFRDHPPIIDPNPNCRACRNRDARRTVQRRAARHSGALPCHR
jgi:hypothetical protein